VHDAAEFWFVPKDGILRRGFGWFLDDVGRPVVKRARRASSAIRRGPGVLRAIATDATFACAGKNAGSNPNPARPQERRRDEIPSSPTRA